MKRVLVMGVSPGVGKSTFAKKLGKKLDLEVHHLDSLYWQPGWAERDKDSFRELKTAGLSMGTTAIRMIFE